MRSVRSVDEIERGDCMVSCPRWPSCLAASASARGGKVAGQVDVYMDEHQVGVCTGNDCMRPSRQVSSFLPLTSGGADIELPDTSRNVQTAGRWPLSPTTQQSSSSMMPLQHPVQKKAGQSVVHRGPRMSAQPLPLLSESPDFQRLPQSRSRRAPCQDARSQRLSSGEGCASVRIL